MHLSCNVRRLKANVIYPSVFCLLTYSLLEWFAPALLEHKWRACRARIILDNFEYARNDIEGFFDRLVNQGD